MTGTGLNVSYHPGCGAAAASAEPVGCVDSRMFPLFYGRLQKAVAVVDFNGLITYVNPSFSQFFEYPKTQSLRGKNIDTIILSEIDWNNVEKLHCLAKYMDHRRALVTFNISKLGQYYLVEPSLPPKSMEAIVAPVLHDIRNPLTSLQEYMRMLKEDPLTETERENIHNKAEVCSDIILDLCEAFLLYYQIERGTVKINEEDFSILQMLQKLHTIMEVKALKKQKALTEQQDPKNFAFHVPLLKQEELLQPIEVLQQIRGDHKKILFVMLNLLGNAFKYTAEGEVFLNAWIEKDGDKKLLCLSVKDTGTGIPETDLPHIFEDCVQLGNGHSGIGKGLANVHQLVEILKGKIFVESSVGKGPDRKGSGSIFTVKFPVQTASGIPSRPTTPEVFAPTPVPERKLDTTNSVLVVNDSKIIRMTLRRKLGISNPGAKIQGLGYTDITEAGSFAEGLAAIKGRHFDLILMDVGLGGGQTPEGEEQDGNLLSKIVRQQESSPGKSFLSKTIIIRFSGDQLAMGSLEEVGMDANIGIGPKESTPEKIKECLLQFDELIHEEPLASPGLPKTPSVEVAGRA